MMGDGATLHATRKTADGLKMKDESAPLWTGRRSTETNRGGIFALLDIPSAASPRRRVHFNSRRQKLWRWHSAPVISSFVAAEKDRRWGKVRSHWLALLNFPWPCTLSGSGLVHFSENAITSLFFITETTRESHSVVVIQHFVWVPLNHRILSLAHCALKFLQILAAKVSAFRKVGKLLTTNKFCPKFLRNIPPNRYTLC